MKFLLFPIRLLRSIKELLRLVPLMSEEMERIRQAIGRVEARQVKDASRIADAEFRVYSQWGEDGIIQNLIGRIPGVDPSFIEFGVEDYRESNTRFLLVNNNWRGLILDAAGSQLDTVRRSKTYWQHSLTAVTAFITRENINDLIQSAGFAGDIGLLSVDIDGNDYWVWKAIDCVRPAIVVAEYNAILGCDHPLTIPYDPAFDRTRAHFSHVYYGASLSALHALGEEKGYALVASNSAGNNAFFVRRDLLGTLKALRPADVFVKPRFREARNPDGSLGFLDLKAARDLIADMPLVNVSTGQVTNLRAAGV